MRSDALIALTRFGLGPRAGEVAAVATDPRGHLEAQLSTPEATHIDGLETLAELQVLWDETQRPYEAVRARLADGGNEAEQEEVTKARRRRNRTFRDVADAEVAARFRHGATTGSALLERLVLFWSNHFAIDKSRGLQVRTLVGNFEREAIRPHVLGTFEDMLVASTLHPAMLHYLDNVRSVAPGSRLGQRRGVERANENLARELLELHTLGAGSGYTQGDVAAVALVLAGWTGGFTRRSNTSWEGRYHDAAPRTVLGRTYEATGRRQIDPLLADLAHHPATARHVAGKFARHFVGDLAPATLTEALERSFLDTGGDLAELTRTLLAHDAAWVPDPAKTVPPYDFMVGAARALGLEELAPRLLNTATKDLAQDVWAPPSPAGWPDADDAFLGGDAMLERIDFAGQLVGRVDLPDVRALASDLVGADLQPAVAEALGRAEDNRQAGVLLLMSPLFQRR